MTDRRVLRWGFLGRVPYREAEALQHRLRDELKRGTGDEHLLLLEHPHVYTLGRNADPADVKAGLEWRAARGVEVAECNRGGQVTYHGPGQLVGYPILDLAPDRKDVRRYVRDLEEVLLRTLADFRIAGRRRDGSENIGVWVGDDKIASLGVHLSRWHTTHGFALNVSTDLGYFAGIVACGLAGVRMASMAGLAAPATPPAVEAVAEVCARRFAEVFDRRLEPLAAAAAAL